MIVTVWLLYKRGEPRIYTRTVQPTEEQSAAYRRDGFKVFRASIDIPVEEPVDGTAIGCAWPDPPEEEAIQ